MGRVFLLYSIGYMVKYVWMASQSQTSAINELMSQQGKSLNDNDFSLFKNIYLFDYMGS